MKTDTSFDILQEGLFCILFPESFPCLPGWQGCCITIVELSENILQNLGNDLMADSVVSQVIFIAES